MASLRLFLVLAALVISGVSFGQSHPPSFGQYPISERYTGHQATPKLLPGTAAWRFRTRIREAAQNKPNFAGHYVLVRWGCGTECVSGAIIDVKSGAVYFEDITACCWFNPDAPRLPAHFEPIDFRLTSRLVIFAGLLGEEGRNGPHYFKFEGGKLVALR